VSSVFLKCTRQSYLHVQLATIAFENEQYLKAAEQFTEILMTTMAGLSLRTALCEPRLKIFTVVGHNKVGVLSIIDDMHVTALRLGLGFLVANRPPTTV
jgi:hypothetical protein